MKGKKAYWWVSVGGHSCEPAVLADGKIYTFGCADPFDANSKHIALVEEMTGDIPDTPAVAARREAAWERQKAADRKRGVFHGYRRF